MQRMDFSVFGHFVVGLIYSATTALGAAFAPWSLRVVPFLWMRKTQPHSRFIRRIYNSFVFSGPVKNMCAGSPHACTLYAM